MTSQMFYLSVDDWDVLWLDPSMDQDLFGGVRFQFPPQSAPTQ